MLTPIWELVQPPEDLADDLGRWLPDVIPDWVLAMEPVTELSCDCSCVAHEVAVSVGWAIPGVTGLDKPAPPSVSPQVTALQQLVRAVCTTDPTVQAPAQALVDTEALLALGRELRLPSRRPRWSTRR